MLPGELRRQCSAAACLLLALQGALLITQAQYASRSHLGEAQYASFMEASVRVCSTSPAHLSLIGQQCSSSSASGTQGADISDSALPDNTSLRWFGALPHASLRQAQQEYSNCGSLAMKHSMSRMSRIVRSVSAALHVQVSAW